MDKIAVFAHYDGDNIIKDYVIYYLKELNKIAQKIIFVSDCDLPQQELKKIENIVYHSIAHRHGEYDFGSYKRGYLYAKENGLLNNCEELIFSKTPIPSRCGIITSNIATSGFVFAITSAASFPSLQIPITSMSS